MDKPNDLTPPQKEAVDECTAAIEADAAAKRAAIMADISPEVLAGLKANGEDLGRVPLSILETFTETSRRQDKRKWALLDPLLRLSCYVTNIRPKEEQDAIKTALEKAMGDEVAMDDERDWVIPMGAGFSALLDALDVPTEEAIRERALADQEAARLVRKAAYEARVAAGEPPLEPPFTAENPPRTREDVEKMAAYWRATGEMPPIEPPAGS